MCYYAIPVHRAALQTPGSGTQRKRFTVVGESSPEAQEQILYTISLGYNSKPPPNPSATVEMRKLKPKHLLVALTQPDSPGGMK